MEVVEDATMKIAHDLLGEEQNSVSSTVEERDAKHTAAEKALVVLCHSAEPMVVVKNAAMKIAQDLLGEDQDSVSCTVGERDAKERTALKALKVFRDSAYPMVVVGDVNLLDAQKERKGAKCSAKHA
jgi:predicted thioesterase